MAIAPALEDFHRRREKLLRHAAVPIFRLNGQRTKETEAAPVGCKIGADKPFGVLRGDHGGRIGLPARSGHVAVAAHARIVRRQSEKCRERDADDAARLVKIAVDERPDKDVGLRLRCGHGTIYTQDAFAGKPRAA